MTMNNTPQTSTNLNWLWTGWDFLAAPHPSVQEVGERRNAQLLSALCLILTGSFIWGILSNPTGVDTFVLLLAITLVSYALSRTRYYRLGSYFFSYGFTFTTYVSLYLGTASSFDTSITTIAHVAIIVSSILLPLEGFIALVVLSTIATFSAPLYSHIPIDIASGFFRDSGVYMSIGIILIGANIFRSSIEQNRLRDAQKTNAELEDIKKNLEQRVDERTAQLEEINLQTSRRAGLLQAITELSEAIAELHDPNEIFPATAKLIHERFGFYHVGIFLTDKDNQFAVLQAANSEGGKRMLERHHQLKLGTGVVGYCAQTGQPRIALDVGTDAIFFDNPDLPETRSEVALPMISRGKAVGVLDVQSTEAGAFSTEDLQVLTTLANQVSIALENALLLTEARAALAQVQEVYNEFTRAEWSRTISKAEQKGFRYQTGRIEMLENDLHESEIVKAIQSGDVAKNQEKRTTVAVPVKLRGEVIGILHIESNNPAKEWQADEVSLVEAVAERAAFAMENARLFQDARRRAAKERLISEATSRISGALNMENILQTTAEELERLLGGSEVLIQFQSKERS